MKKDYASHRVGVSLAYLLVTLTVVLRGGSAVVRHRLPATPGNCRCGLSFVSGNFDADRADEVFVGAGGRQAAWGAVESAVHISRLGRPAR
jgi:hypothetical protein